MGAEHLSRLRFWVFLAAGLIIGLYGALALLWDVPNPFWIWLPTVAGAAAGAIVWLSAGRADPKDRQASFDELFRLEWARAVQRAYWIAIGLYPVFGLLLTFDLRQPSTAFAAMGTLTGAAPLLAFCVISGRA